MNRSLAHSFRTVWIAVIMLFFNSLANAQAFYAVLVADTRDAVLGAGCEKDLQEMSGTLRGISKKIGYRFQEIICHQERFGKRSIEEAISEIQCNPDDIIFFYYTGHGINNASEKSAFPILNLKGENLELETVHRSLKAKNPRFCLTLADCCNNLLPSRTVRPDAPVKRGITVTQDTRIMRDLFVQANGDLLISSAQKGEQATAHPQNGSFYSKTWMQALAYAGSHNSRVSWETLLTDAEKRLQETLKGLPDAQKHHSQWAGNLPETADFEMDKTRLMEFKKISTQRLTDLQLYITMIADKNLSDGQREQAVELAVSLFEKDRLVNGKRRSPHVQVTRRNGSVISVPVRIYFKNLLHAQFDKVQITSYDAAVVTGFQQNSDGSYHANATCFQQFKGTDAGGNLVYGHRDRKDIRVTAESAALYEHARKEDLKLFFGDITVKDTVPIPGFQ